MPNAVLIDDLLDFIRRSPTPWHAVDNACNLLAEAGFTHLRETDRWPAGGCKAGFVTRDDGSLIAFRAGRCALLDGGIRLAGVHTDSPCLRIRPRPTRHSQGYAQFNVETYGGVLLHPWYDRDLSVAGRVTGADADGQLVSTLVDFRDPIAFIPSLAIHLDREANKGRNINPQTELSPVVLRLGDGESFDLEQVLLDRINAGGDDSIARVLSWDLLLYDTQPPARVGLRGEFIASARLDNLLSTYVALRALLAADDEHASMIVCNDHEEVGSVSASGAQGTFLSTVLERLIAQEDTHADAFSRTIRQSLMLSIDNAHGVHPNFPGKHDGEHRPLLNGGPVVKSNANQRYAGSSTSAALFQSLCERTGVPCQWFANRADLACGSTIGPLTAAELGIPVLDIGVAQFGMHSIRELAGSEDPDYLLACVTEFFNRLV
ncbi:MAG: M18 family aminopeptidase [Gammaproteobacteria bacterium]|nr:M18 family aminopeptidase [Gammaproteobacteria bacterium]